jgi:hypothetical protein
MDSGCPGSRQFLGVTWDQQYFHSGRNSGYFFVVLGPIPMFGLVLFRSRRLWDGAQCTEQRQYRLLLVELARRSLRTLACPSEFD